MANALLTPSIIAKEALVQLDNNLVMAGNVHREYKKEFVKVGDTVTIRKPVKFVTSSGATLVKQDVEEGNTTMVIDQRKHVGWEFTTQDLTLKIEDYSERYIKPAMITLANTIDGDVLGLYKYVWNMVGTPGTTPSTFAHVSATAQRLDLQAVATDERKLVLDPTAGWAVAGAQTALYMQKMAEQAYREGSIGQIAGLDTYRTQNVKTHTVGAWGGTPLTNGAAQQTTYALSKTTNTQSLITDGWTNSITGIVKQGDVFTIAGVYAVNPVTKATLSYLQQFVVQADANSGASTGPATLTIAPAMILTGPYQNISAAPADNAAITMVGTASTNYPQNLAFHRNAFALVTVPLEMPDGVPFSARETYKGMSVRVVKQYDITNDTDVIRLDVLYGVKAIYPELATRLFG